MAKVELTLQRWNGDRAALPGEESSALVLAACNIDGVPIPTGRVRLYSDGFLSIGIEDIQGVGLPDYPLSQIESVEHVPATSDFRAYTVLRLPVSELSVRIAE